MKSKLDKATEKRVITYNNMVKKGGWKMTSSGRVNQKILNKKEEGDKGR